MEPNGQLVGPPAGKLAGPFFGTESPLKRNKDANTIFGGDQGGISNAFLPDVIYLSWFRDREGVDTYPLYSD